MPQIYDMGPTALLPLRRKACWGFFRAKNPTVSAGFDPANLGTKGQHATPRPPKPLTAEHHVIFLRSRKYHVWSDLIPSFMYCCSNNNRHAAALILYTFCRAREEFVIAAKPPSLAVSNNRTKCISTLKYYAAIRITANNLKCRFALQDTKSHP